MAKTGPVPNRTEDLSRARDAHRGGRQDVTKGTSREATIPEPDPDWHSSVRMFWDSALASGQADFYESSDYAKLYLLCDLYSKALGMSKLPAILIQTIFGQMEGLLITEGDRRRARIELEKVGSDEDPVVEEQMEQYERGLYLVPPLAS